MSEFWRRHMCGSTAICIAFLVMIGCGQDAETQHTNPDSGFQEDAGAQDASDVADDLDTGDLDSGDAELDADDTGDIDAGQDTDTGVEPGVPPVDDYVVCTSDLDCPINGSECVTYASFNRPDRTGLDELPLSELFEGLEAGEGVCSQNCSTDPTVCDGVQWPDGLGQTQPSSCVVVATGAAPYVVASLEPFDVSVDLNEAAAGQPFGAICMPALQSDSRRGADFCQSCDGPDACGEGSRCYNFLNDALRENTSELGQSSCLQTCNESADCPLGFSCEGDADAQVCVPVGGSCDGCVDRDENGYGTGHCGPASARQTPHDCDDTNPLAYYNPLDEFHSFPDQCGAVDTNCDGILDDVQQIGSEPWGSEHCTACGDTCSGTVGEGGTGIRRCEGTAGAAQCIVECVPGRASCNGDPTDGCPIETDDENYLYFEDADGDGFGDTNMEPRFFCDPTAAAAALQNPIAFLTHPQVGGGAPLLDCDDTNNQIYPDAPNLCDGIDNSCSGLPQGEVTDIVGASGACTITAASNGDAIHGVCQNGEFACTEQGGAWAIRCTQVTYPNDNAEICDGLDNTCSGSIDDVPNRGSQCNVEGQLGVCSEGALECVPDQGPALICTQQNVPALEAPGFDGVDQSCDGFDRYGRLEDGVYVPHVVFVGAGSTNAINTAIASAAQCQLDVAGNEVPCDVFIEPTTASLPHRSNATIDLIDGVSLFGSVPGNQDAWKIPASGPPMPAYSSTSPTSTILVEIESGPVLGMEGRDISSPTHIFGIRLETSDVPESQICASNVAAFCENCSGLRLQSFIAQAGTAGDGRPAVDGAAGGDGGGGGWGEVSFVWNIWWFFVAGGSSPVYPGGTASCNPDQHAWCPNGGVVYNGFDGWGAGGGAGGFTQGGTIDGKDGSGGESIPQQAPSTDYGAFLGEPSINTPAHGSYCTSNHGGTSSPDNHGTGGGGSGLREWVAGTWVGASGGGGGQGGFPGTGGGHGAPSVGMVLSNTGPGPVMNHVLFQSSAGGAGMPGGKGGDGGNGGSRGYVFRPSITTWGGHGGYGAGGNGGHGGNGGASIGLFLHNSGDSGIQYNTLEAIPAGASLGGMGGLAGAPHLSQSANVDISDYSKGDRGLAGESGLTGLRCTRYTYEGDWPTTLTDEAHCQKP